MAKNDDHKRLTAEQLLALLPPDERARLTSLARPLLERQTTSRTLSPATARKGTVQYTNITPNILQSYEAQQRSTLEKLETQVSETLVNLAVPTEKPKVPDPILQSRLEETIRQRNEELQKKDKELQDRQRILEDMKRHHRTDQILFCTEYQHLIETAGKQASPTVKHFGLNTNNLSHIIGTKLDSQSLDLVEYATFYNSIQELQERISHQQFFNNGTPRTTSFYPENVVLVDIIARDKDGKAKQDSDGKLETHTIVLWHTSDKGFMIIDPNNNQFSDHLIPILQSSYPQFNFSHFGTELYKAEDSPEKRDCIDIAAKIAFVINEEEKAGKSQDDIRRAIDGQFLSKNLRDPNLTTNRIYSSDRNIRAQYDKFRTRSSSSGRR